MPDTNLDFNTIVQKFDEILSRGLCRGLGTKGGEMCVEAAICTAMGLPFGDDPICVTKEIRDFKVCLNDANWSSSEARAKGLRDLGIAQIGSKGVVDGNTFLRLLNNKLVKVLLPILRKNLNLFDGKDFSYWDVAHVFESAATIYSVKIAYAIEGVNFQFAGSSPDKYLILGAELALEVLKELKSPGCEWI